MVAPSSSYRCKYHAFLSFRGEDTRKGFSDHLYRALELAGIHTFRDDEDIERGADITSEIHKAIQESHVSIIVLSKDYGSSRWCLEELGKIIERQNTDGHMVLPVFYKVDPSDVRKQSGSLAEAFSRHEELFEEAMVTKWRKALTDVADLGGMVLGDQFESQLIQNIVEEIGKKLNPRTLNVAPYAIGINDRAEGINLWLRDGSDDVGVAGIYGMGGIGKTTIAKAAYNMNLDSFQESSFLADIRATSEQPNGLVCLQMKLISDIQKRKPDKIYSVDEGLSRIKHVVSSKTVLIVLDDLNDLDQFNAIIGMREWFHPGSKIIVTTRDEHVLKANGVSKMFVVQELDEQESLELFSWHAFRQAHPIQSYMELSTLVVHHCGGLPLALQVLGSSLFGKSVDVWRSALEKLDVIPDAKIQKVLRISFDSLQDDHDKNLFLHIAYFFIGREKDFTISILDNLGFFTRIGIENLVNRCLMQIRYNKLVMHQLLADMGKGIIREESPENPGKRSRVEQKDASITLKNLIGTESIRGLKLNLPLFLKGTSSIAVQRGDKKRCHAEEYDGNFLKRRRLCFFSWKAIYFSSTNLTPSNEADFTTEAFRRMLNIEILLLNNLKLNGGYEDFPKKLTWLSWQRFYLKSIPENFYLGNLVVLEMQNSSLQFLWKGAKFLPSLKVLDLSHSHGLLRTPDLSRVPNLERLLLKNCISIDKIDESIGDLEKLVILNLEDCKNLVKLPKRIMMLISLQELILSGCSKLILHGNGAASNQLLSTVTYAKKLGLLFNKSWQSMWLRVSPRNTLLSAGFSLASLPHSLVRLNISYCNLSEISSDLSVSSLKYLNLSGNPILSLPENMKSLTTLEDLIVQDCTKLKTLPELPPGLRSLVAINCSSLKHAAELPYMGRLLRPIFWNCNELVEVQRLFNIKPLRSTDIEMIKDKCLYDFESIGDPEIEMTNCLTHTIRTGPIQGLYECGIFSIFLHGSTIPDWYNYKSMGKPLLSITVPSKLELKIRGINVCVVYTKHPDRNKLYSSITLKVSNETKGLMWAYRPVTIGSPIRNVDILWLSHWPFGRYDLEGGEVLCVSVDQRYENLIKELGVHLVYEQENTCDTCECVQFQSKREDATVQQDLPYWSQNDVVGNMSVSASKYQIWRGKYFLCNLRCNAYRAQFRRSQGNPALLDFSYEPDGPYNYLCEHKAYSAEDCEESSLLN